MRKPEENSRCRFSTISSDPSAARRSSQTCATPAYASILTFIRARLQHPIHLARFELIAEGKCRLPSCQVLVFPALPPERQATVTQHHIGIAFEITGIVPKCRSKVLIPAYAVSRPLPATFYKAAEAYVQHPKFRLVHKDTPDGVPACARTAIGFPSYFSPTTASDICSTETLTVTNLVKCHLCHFPETTHPDLAVLYAKERHERLATLANRKIGGGSTWACPRQ